jgi:hypothetical protein
MSSGVEIEAWTKMTACATVVIAFMTFLQVVATVAIAFSVNLEGSRRSDGAGAGIEGGLGRTSEKPD